MRERLKSTLPPLDDRTLKYNDSSLEESCFFPKKMRWYGM